MRNWSRVVISLMISSAILRCLVEKCSGNDLNHANKSAISKADSSAIFLSAILK